jgi:ribonuclease P protein component
VRRNRLRRQLREIARRRVLPALAPLDMVIRSRASAYGAESHEFAGDLEQWAHTLSG